MEKLEVDKKDVSMSIKFDADLYKEVKREAKKQERSFSSMVRLVLKDWLLDKMRADFSRKST